MLKKIKPKVKPKIENISTSTQQKSDIRAQVQPKPQPTFDIASMLKDLRSDKRSIQKQITEIKKTDNQKKINQQIIKGDRFGIIKFGSRVDLYLPRNYKTLVSVGQHVIGGETIISNPNNVSKINRTLKI